MVKDFANGKSDAIIMHIDTTKLLAREEWELLEAAGATVVVVHKALPDSGG
jgi:hypothetical protein